MPSFTGEWFSTFGKLTLTQEGGSVRGPYEHNGGVLEGTLNGAVLSGTWREGDRGGPCELTLDEAGNEFHGNWKEHADTAWRGDWSGVRLALPRREEGGSPAAWNSHAEGPLLSGPMVGEVGETDAFVWAQARDTSPLTLTVHRGDGSTLTVGASPSWDEWLCVLFHVEGLRPGERCEYSIAGARGETARRPLRAAPPRSARRLRVAFGSCFWDDTNPNLTIFDAIRREQADVFLMIGDNCYYDEPDWQTQHTMMMAQLRARNGAPLRRLFDEVPVLAIWDDHDFGWNDSDSSFTNRAASAPVFERVWAQRRYGTQEAPGIFSAVRMGPVEMFLLDDRSHRVERDHIHGEGQLAWLFDALARSDAPVKLIVSGSQVFPEVAVGREWECWRRDATRELDRLLSFIEERDIQGVVFLSGDVHLGYLIREPTRRLAGGRRGPDLWELTASPLANEPWTDLVIGRDDYDRTLVEEHPVCNYGVVEVDLDRPGAEVRLALKDPSGAELVTQPVPLASLRVRDAAEGLSAVLRAGDAAWFFRGDRYVRWDVAAGASSAGPREIAAGWTGVPPGRLDAAVAWNNGRAYFFRGNGYVAYDLAADRALDGYPKYIGRQWPGLFPHGIDAAVVWDAHKAYFFRGSEYTRYDLAADRADPGYPQPIAAHWPGVFPEGIDAVVVWGDGKAYFFKGREYVSYDMAADRADPGYPRPIEERWPGVLGELVA
jgi:hypothetical protein